MTHPPETDANSPPLHPACLPEDALLAECRWSFDRRSGPGGQHRNKVETAATIVHQPSQIQAQASERRSQAANRQMALFRLRVQLALDLRRPVAWPYRPSPLWQGRLRGRRIVVGETHDDYPALLAEGMDVIAAADADLSLAAEQLGCSTTQLVRFLAQEPRALAQVNQLRQARGLRPLRA